MEQVKARTSEVLSDHSVLDNLLSYIPKLIHVPNKVVLSKST